MGPPLGRALLIRHRSQDHPDATFCACPHPLGSPTHRNAHTPMLRHCRHCGCGYDALSPCLQFFRFNRPCELPDGDARSQMSPMRVPPPTSTYLMVWRRQTLTAKKHRQWEAKCEILAAVETG
jgi:hypothetical protein